MARVRLKSEQQIIGSMIRTLLAESPLRDINPGSVVLTLLEAAAREDYAQYYQMLQIIRNYNLDTTFGSDLDNRAFEYGIERRLSLAATGKVTILRESGFTRIASSQYTGARSRIAGDTEVLLNDGSLFPTSGVQQTLIIGRGTQNEEEVNYTPSPTNPDNNTNFFRITLDTPLVNDHALEEEILLKQGNDISIPAGTVIRVPASSSAAEISFRTINDVTLLAGELEVTDVDVRATEPGRSGNILVNAISGEEAFPTPPFPNARATNDSAFSTGRDRETDTSLRNRIKSHIQGLTQSTKAGISDAINGLVDPSTSKRVVSSNIILPDNVGEPVVIYIDDGTGFEPSFENQGQETIVASAEGGEQRLQLDLFPIVKAQIETGNAEPYDFSGVPLTLQVTAGTQTETLTFFEADFRISEAATAEEVSAAINNKSNLLEARTSQNGARVVINAKSDVNDNVQVIGGTANAPGILGFTSDLVETFYLYKNDELLSKDGETASIVSGTSAPYDFSGPAQTLSVIVDGKASNTQTVTIQESDFESVAAAATATAAQVAVIVNSQLAGAFAEDAGGFLRVTSNTQLSESSQIQVLNSPANLTLGFSTTQVVGKDQDYTLNAELGVIELVEPLAEFDRVTAGSRNTRAFLTSTVPAEYSYPTGTLELIFDGVAETVSLLGASNQSAQVVADLINSQISGGKIVTRSVGNDQFLEVRTNTYDLSGTVEVGAASDDALSAALGFAEGVEKTNLTSQVAFQVSVNTSPFVFVEGETLVVVLNNDPSGQTFIITMDFDATVTAATSASNFASGLLSSVFTENDVLNDFWLVFKSGDNTIEETVEEVSRPVAGTSRYFFETPPTNYEDFAAGDQATFSDMTNAANDGNYLLTAVNVVTGVLAAVEDQDIANPSALTPILGQRYIVAPDAQDTTATDVQDATRSDPTGLPLTSGLFYIVAAGAQDTQLDPVLGLFTDSGDPGVNAVHGNRYIVNGTGTGDWVGHDFEIAEYNGIGTPGWIFEVPANGDVVKNTTTGDVYQFDSAGPSWDLNPWGGQAGRIAEWNGSSWVFSSAPDKQVRQNLDTGTPVQYDQGTNSWVENLWGGEATSVAEWNGASWDFTTPSTSETALVNDEALTYQFDGSSWVEFRFWVEVTNVNGTVESGSAGTGLVGQRRQILDYTGSTGVLITDSFRAVPALSDEFVILPSTRDNVVDFFNNQTVTSLSASAEISLADQGTRVQIASLANGSDGFVQVTGGEANDELQFANTLSQGLRAYAYYVGLIKQVHSTIYGDEANLTSFPGVGAAGVKFKILAPTVQEVPITLDITLREGTSLSSVENSIKSAVTNYVNNLGVSEAVILSNIIDRVVEVDGILDAVITSPVENVDIAENERARTKSSIITIT